MDKRIQDLETELQKAKRQKIEEDKRGTLEELIDNAFSAWGYHLEKNASRKDFTKKYTLRLYAPAGREYRYSGPLQSFRYLRLEHPWSIYQYANSETTGWSCIQFCADTLEDLITPAYKLLWTVGVTFFVIETYGSTFSPVEEDYVRPVLVGKIPPTSVDFYCGDLRVDYDLSTEKGIERAFALTTQNAIYKTIDEEIEHLEGKLAKLASELEKKKKERETIAAKPRPFPL